MRPSEYVLIRSALKSARYKRPVFDSEKSATPPIVELRLSVAKVSLVLGRKPSCRVQPNLVEHSAEIDQATDFIVRAAESGHMRHGS